MQHTSGAAHVQRTPNRKQKVVAATLAMMAIGGAAFAFWTTTGEGDGSAAAGDVDPIVVNQTTDVSTLAPGADPVTLSGDFTNGNDVAVTVGTLTVTIDSVTGGTPTEDDPTCETADYELTDQTVGVDASINPGTGGSWTGPKIALIETGVNQDACKGASVNLKYSLS